LISHSQDKTFKDEQGNEFNQIIPTLENKARLVCERTCDIIGYSRIIDTEEGAKTKLFLRGTPRFVAGSRFAYIEPVIDFSYDDLVKAIGDAVDKEAAINDNKFITNEKVTLHTEAPSYDFDAMMNEFQTLVEQLCAKDETITSKIVSIVDTHLGKGRKVYDCTVEQTPQLDLILFELKQLI
jgi:hypothetical protein